MLSFLQKLSPPAVPRPRAVAANPVQYPKLAVFASTRVWDWIKEYVQFRLGPKHAFRFYDGGDGDDGVYQLKGDAQEIRIALAADWGTGTDEAESVAQQITAYKPHYTIHLGDVYYVGDPVEVGENFLGIPSPNNQYAPVTWPSGSVGTFALNGNHEMLARGVGYFDHMLPKLGLHGSAHGQRASFFCLENEHWRIIAIDTAYNSVGTPVIEYIVKPDCTLPKPHVEWLRDIVRPRPEDTRGIVILSHHQYYSRFDVCYPKPARQLAASFTRPVLWLWGHEHRLAIYETASMPGGVTAIGRCIGHGGMPVDLPTRPKADYATEFLDNRHYPNDENLKLGYNGFAKMTLQGPELALDYVDLHGTEVFSETWRTEHGELVRTRHWEMAQT